MPSPITITLTMTEPAPYTNEDMFREPGTGRSLHDDANSFYRKVMGLAIPIKAVAQPTIDSIHDAIKSKVSKTDYCMWSIIYGLQLSQLKELWPGAATSPQNSMGKLWVACRNYGAAAMRFHHAENVQNMSQKAGVVTPSKRSSVHSPPKVLEKSCTSTSSAKKLKSNSQNSLKSPTVSVTTPKKNI